MRVCLHRMYTCPSERCNFIGKRMSFKMHLVQSHIEDIVHNARSFFFGAAGECWVKNGDLAFSKINGMGNNAHVGSSGKYYCRQSLDNDDSNTKKCGPNLGDNCKSCMKLDIEVRNLPMDWYVNKKGASCRRVEQTGLFYCGRKMKASEPHCGPFEGPNCRYCQEIQEQVDKRYSGIWH